MVRTVLLLIMTGVFSAGVFVHENNYDKAVRTYRENKLDSATWYSDLAIQHYLNNGKTDSLVLARVQKALLIWDMHGIEAAMRYTDTTLVLSAGLPPKNIARVAAFSRMGRLHVQRHELSQAARYFTKAEKEILSSVPNLHYAILYNNMAIMHFTEEKYKDARIYSERAYATNLKLEGKDGINMPIILQTRYLISLYSENYEQALQDGEEFQRVMILHYPPDHPNIGTMHNSLASLYETLRQYEKAMHHRQKAVRLHYNSYIKSGDGFSLAASYQNMGQLYGYINEPFMAQEYLEKGSRLLEKTFGRDGAGMVKPLTDIAINKSKSGKYQEAEALFERALAIQKNHARHDLLGLAYVEGFMANMYFEYKQIDRAIALYRTVADRYAKANAAHTENALQNQHSLTQALSAKGEYDQALALQKSNLIHFRKLYPRGNDAIAYRFYGISQTYLDMGKPYEAMALSDSIFCELLVLSHLPSELSEWFTRLPFSFHTLLYINQRTKALYYLYEATSDKQLLDKLLSITESYTHFFSTNLHVFRTQTALIDLADVNKEFYSLAIEACWALSNEGQDETYTQKAFYYAEYSKALLMRLAANDITIESQQDHKDHTAQRNYALQNKITSLNLHYLNNSESDSLLTRLSDAMEEYKDFQDSLKKTGNTFFFSKYNHELPSLNKIRKTLLTNKETLVEYAITDQSLFIFVLTADSFHVYRQNTDVLKDIYLLHKLHGLTVDEFVQPAFRLYEALIQPIEPFITANRLLIIPDGDLYYLNFEILISHQQATGFAQMPYIIHLYDLSYLLSASSAVQLKFAHNNQDKKDKALIFVPVFTDQMKVDYRKSLPDPSLLDDDYLYLFRQPFALQAAKRIGDLVPHDLYMEQAADEYVFKQAAANYKILHLGTHAEVNNYSPLHSRLCLAKPMYSDTSSTEDGYLHTYEIYSMQLKAELAVLTACETGAGTWRNGEGVVSLAHGFMYAGCPSIVMSLWKIDEKSSSDLITEFYEQLSKGQHKARALKAAKLKIIKSQDDRLAHPYYWAGVVLVGDTQAIFPNKARWDLVVLSLAILLLGGIFLRLNRLR